MDVKNSITLEYDLSFLEFLIKFSSKSHAMLECMPLFCSVRYNALRLSYLLETTYAKPMATEQLNLYALFQQCSSFLRTTWNDGKIRESFMPAYTLLVFLSVGRPFLFQGFDPWTILTTVTYGLFGPSYCLVDHQTLGTFTTRKSRNTDGRHRWKHRVGKSHEERRENQNLSEKE